ncbi:hypothetical protein DH2020_007371 [Rehmannia glutinosa]|uniref:Enoyl reductase (ER) domain-containing protein n=1 Tax=Rehmannia glutinosa TaxID=99300 RepID=A0ABR0TY18_REHGL
MDNTAVESSKTAGKPIKCRAAVARKAGESLVMEEVIVGPPKSGEVRIKIICTSLCYSDVTFLKLKDPPACFPRILGHEAVGVVESVGDGVSELVEGDMVIPVFMPECTECVGAAWKTANVEEGSTVAIFGLGSIGLAVAEGARLCGAAKIIGVDVNPEKLEISKAFGVTDFVDSSACGEKRVSQIINEMTGGGADCCFECVGKASLVEEAFACCRKGWGKTIVLGVDRPGAQLTFSSFEVLHLGKTIMGSLFGGLKPKSDIPILIKRYLDKELELDKFVTHEVSFQDINKAFDLLVEGKCLRLQLRASVCCCKIEDSKGMEIIVRDDNEADRLGPRPAPCLERGGAGRPLRVAGSRNPLEVPCITAVNCPSELRMTQPKPIV